MKTREELILQIPKNSKGVEVGVFEGKFSEFIINSIDPSEFYLVDLFYGNGISGDKNGENIKTICLETSYNNLIKKYKNLEHIKIIRNKSIDFFKELPDNYLDFVYIDGDHSYEGVKTDLEYAIKKVKKGGFICGHDYSKSFLGVIKAVDEFCQKNKISFSITTEDKLPSFYFIA